MVTPTGVTSEVVVVLRSRPTLAVALAAAVLLAGCRGEEGPVVDTAEVVGGEVVQTVPAAATLQPAARVEVTAPAGGTVIELAVADGDVVEAGDTLARIASDGIELQIAQAQAAVEAADALAGAAGGAGLDLSPVLGAFRGQLDAVVPPLLDALATQAAQVDAEELREDAQARIDEARRSYEQSRANLAQAEADARDQAEQATSAQRAAAAAQRRQAELALEAAESREDELLLVAPADGVVQLARGGDDGGGGGLPPLDDLAGGGLEGGAAGLGDLFGGGGAGSSGGPIAQGVTVAAGQPLLTIFDLSGFTAEVAVDELDVVEVAEGQSVTVTVDAFPEHPLPGAISFVALSPRNAGAGAASYPVTVDLLAVPEEVRLRAGLTASAEIEVRRVAADLVVPTSALLRRGEVASGAGRGEVASGAGRGEVASGAGRGEVVHVVRDGVAVEVPVTVLAIGEETAAIEGDLAAGELVVTTGVETVADGDRIEP